MLYHVVEQQPVKFPMGKGTFAPFRANLNIKLLTEVCVDHGQEGLDSAEAAATDLI